MINTKEEYDAYMEAVDTVCIECKFTEEVCDKCPVKTTVYNIAKNLTDADRKER